MKKILVISNTAFSIIKFREHYLSKLKNYKFDIWTPNYKAKLSKKSKNLKSYKFESKNIIIDFIKIYKILKLFKHSKIIVYSYKYQFVVSLLKKILLLDVEIISLIAGRGSLQIGNFYEKYFYNLIVKIIINTSKIVICINPEDKKYFYNFTKERKKIFLLPTEGVELIKSKKYNNRKKNFLFFGRLIKEKGISEYIETAKIIKKNYPNTNFFIAGPTTQSIIGQSKFNKKTFELIEENKMYVKYIGYFKDYKKIFQKTDCLVSPSFSEGAGTSVMEAMIFGLYIVAYKNSGHNYLLKHTFNHLCEKNNIESLVKGIKKFLKIKKKKINKSRLQAYTKVMKNFSSDTVSKKFERILEINY